MKKSYILIFAAATCIMSLASCVSETMVYEDNDAEIGFAPVSGPATKIVSGAMDTEYSQYETFAVFAYHKIVPYGLSWSDFTDLDGNLSVYLANSSFCRQENGQYWRGGYLQGKIKYERLDSNDPDYIKGSSYIVDVDGDPVYQPKYWPKTGSLIFAGYSPYQYTPYPGTDNDGDLNAESLVTLDETRVSYDTDSDGEYANPSLTINGFTQGRYEWEKDNHWATNNTVDLMWFDVDDADNRSADASTTVSGDVNAVPVRFHHACSWVDFKVRTDESQPEAADKFVILKVELDNLYWSGDFTSNNGDDVEDPAEWTGLGNLQDVVLYFNFGEHAVKEAGMSDDEYAEADAESDYGKKFNYVDETGFILGGLMAIPQPLEKTGSGTTLTIYYKQLTSDTKYEPAQADHEDGVYSGTPLTEVFTYNLTGEWEMGKHYVYDIVFGLDEIRIDPSTVDWETVNSVVTVN